MNYKKFIINLDIYKKIFEIYQLFSFKFLNLLQYTQLIKNIIKLTNILVKKKKFFKSKILLLKKKNFNILKFAMLNFLKKKIIRYNLQYIRLLYIFLKKKFIIKIFKNFYYVQNFNKKKLPLFLKLNFNINTSSYFFLEKERIKNFVKISKQLIRPLFYIYLLTKFKYYKKYKYIKIYDKLKYFFFFLKKKKKKKKKNILFVPNYDFLNNLDMLNNISKLSFFLKKKVIRLSSFYFLLNIKNYLYEYFLFVFKNELIEDLILNINTHFLSTISFFDFKNDFILPKKNFIFKLININIKFFFNNRYKNDKIY